MSLHPIKHSNKSNARRSRKHAYFKGGRRATWASGWGSKPSFAMPRPNGQFNYFFSTKKGKILTILLLSLLIIGIGDQLLKNPVTGTSPIDPLKPLWGETLAKNDLSSFDCKGGGGASFGSNIFSSGGSTKGVVLKEVNAFGFPLGVVCINQSPFDVSTASAKELDFWASWGWNNSVSGAFPPQVYLFLTRNNTATAVIGDYVPNSDPNVAFIYAVNVNPSGANTFGSVVYFQRDPTRSIVSDDHGCSNTSGSVYFCSPVVSNTWGLASSVLQVGFVDLNYTSSSAATSPSRIFDSGCPSGCLIQNLPWFNIQGQKYYLGIGVRGATSACPCNNPAFQASMDSQSRGTAVFTPGLLPGTVAGMEVDQYVPPTISPSLDASGFFGPLIRALVSLGIFIINGMFAFIAFITPTLQAALLYLKTIIQSTLDFIGNSLGWGNIGTNFFTILNQIISFFTDVNSGLPFWLGQFANLFTNVFSGLQVGTKYIAYAVQLASITGQIIAAGLVQALVIFGIGLTFLVFSGSFLFFLGYFLYTGDDALGGLITFLGAVEAISFNILERIAQVTNFGLDILMYLIGLIPKPFIQITAARFPRLPIFGTGAVFHMPVMDLGELRSGNMLSAWLWMIGFYMFGWYESRNPSLIGSVGQLLPATATNMRQLSAFLPIIQMIVLLTGGWCLFWLAMRPLHLIGMDLGAFEEIGVGPGRKTGGLGGITVKAGQKKLFQRRVQARANAQGYFKREGHIEKGIATNEAVSPGALFD